MVPGPHPTSSSAVPGEVGEEVGAGVLGRAPGVAAQHGFVVPVRVGHASIVACPNCPRCRRCPNASTPSWRGDAERADLLGFSSLKTSRRPRPTPSTGTTSCRSGAGPSTSSGVRRRQPDGAPSVPGGPPRYEEPPRRRASWLGGPLHLLRPVATSPSTQTSPSWSASTGRSARHRGGCCRRATTDRWPASGQNRGATSFAAFIRTGNSQPSPHHRPP